MTSVADTVAKMQAKFNPAAAEGLDLVFGFEITEKDEETSYALIVKGKTCTLKEGADENANVTLQMNSETLEGLTSGAINGMEAFMSGKLQFRGDIALAMKLSELFPS